MESVNNLVQRLSHYYWSPQPPYTYVRQAVNGKAPLGIGVLMCHEAVEVDRFAAAFNPAYWATIEMLGRLASQAEHEQAIKCWSKVMSDLNVELDGQTLQTHLLTKTRKEFYDWYEPRIYGELLNCNDVLWLSIRGLRGLSRF